MPDRSLSPKTRFLESKKNTEGHKDVFSSDAARVAIDTALLQLHWRLTVAAPTDVVGQAALFNQLKGARDFIDILMNLGDTPQAHQPERIGNLTHQ